MKRKRGTLYEVGIVDSTYKTQLFETVDGKRKRTWVCPYYTRWKSMFDRCYSDKFHKTNPTYKDCTVCEEWHSFTKFKSWMMTQDWEGKHLDKDLLDVGNKEYHPDRCVFVTKTVNSFMNDHGNARGDLPLGVSPEKSGKFRARVWNPLTGNREYLGCFNDPNEAHIAWKKRKHDLACQLADSEYVTDERVAQALRTRYL